ncbi:MAG TPA: hypothetical protein VFW03_13650 [Gemmatimonadaceae bacterium]|nr:hypothetical protein [Gemmatimonadaceae bacterium]
MAQLTMKSGLAGLVTEGAKVLPDERDAQSPAVNPGQPKDELDDLRAWVVSRCNSWRDHRRQNYENAWDQYERLWRGFWAPEDQNRRSERSKLVTPALGEAVENIVAEVEEAIWGRGDSFDLKAKFDSEEDAKKIVDDNKTKLKEDLGEGEFNANVGEALINAAVYGSGIGEVVIETFTRREITASVAAEYPSPRTDTTASALGAPDLSQLFGPSAPQAAPSLDLGAAGGEMPPQSPEMAGGMPPMPAPAPQTPPMMPGMMPEPVPAPYASANPGPGPMEAKVIEREVSYACLQSVNPRNFLIDPNARTIDKALGCAIEEYVGAHIINKGQKSGMYRKVDVGTSAGDTELGADRQVENEYTADKVHVIRYYGLVPKHLIFPPEQMADLSQPATPGDEMGQALREAEALAEGEGPKEEMVDIDELMSDKKDSTEPVDSEMIEAIVVIANQSVCIKAAENPYLMKDRPVVAFPWDVVPGRFWGRGVCEKGMVPQRVMDAELRARIDALAYVSAPMMAMDATRLPRGFQLTVRPGKSILTNGKPSDVLMPMHFGQLEQSTFNHSQQLDQMVQRATGSLDVIAMASRAGSGDQRSGSTSMMLSGIVKRHKRTLMGFIDRFYVPALRKILWRNMQYNPERYTPRNWDFVASSTMGIIQREYENQTLVQLLNTMEPQSPEYKMILMGVVSNTGLNERRDLIAMLKKSIDLAQQAATNQQTAAADPNTMALQTQLQQATIQLQIAETQAKVFELQSRANLQNVKARNAQLEPQFRQMEIATKGIYQVQADQQDREFKRRMDFVNARLKAADIVSNERIVNRQSQAALATEAVRARAAAQTGAAKAKSDFLSNVAKAGAQVHAARIQATHRPIPGRSATLTA